MGGGIGIQAAGMGEAVVDMVKNLPETLQGLSALVNDAEFRAKVGDAVANDYAQRIDTLTNAYNSGGWDGSVTAGVEAGRLAVDVVTAAQAAVGAVKVTATVAKAGAAAVAGDVAVMARGAAAEYLPSSMISDVRAITASEANAPYIVRGMYSPYDTALQVRTFTTTTALNFVRVSTAENPVGAFLVRADEIAGMTPQQIQQYLALPKIPTQIADVIVPAGTNMQVGRVAAQPAFGVANKGGVQYELLQKISSNNFGTPRVLR